MSDKIEDLVRLTNRRAEHQDKVQVKLRCSAQRLTDLIARAQKKGYEVRVRDGWIFTRVANKAASAISVGGTKPGRKVVGMWTDTHFGCRHSAIDEMIEHRHRCHEAGATVMVHTGDLLDGNRPVLLGDQDRVGFDSQYALLERVVRDSPPMIDVAIDGNHDGYYSAAIGAASGKIVESRMREAGFRWHFAGVCEGRATIHGADWHLWHPAGGSVDKLGVLKVLQDRLRNLEEHVDIIACGHLHKFSSANLGEAFMVCAGTYQRKGSEFSNRISGPWDIGGAIVSYDVDVRGGVHAIAVDFKAVHK